MLSNLKMLLKFFHIGLVKLNTNAKLENTICLLCLPAVATDYTGDNCTVVGYGKHSEPVTKTSEGKVYLLLCNFLAV